MKICLLNDSFPPVIDGVADVVKNYADIIHSQENMEAAVGTTYYPEADYSSLPYHVSAWPGLNTESLTGGYRTGYPFSIRQIGSLIKFAPDLIHTHCPFSSCLIARSLREATGAPVVFTYHTKYDIDIRRSVSLKILQEEGIKAVVHNISSCDEVWTVSRGAGENLASLGYEGEWKIVPNGVDFPKGRVPAETVEQTVRDYDLPADLPVFLFVGRLMDYKGLPLIADALRILSRTADFRMVLIGSGTDGEKMKKTLLEYGISVDETMPDGTIVSHPGAGRYGKVIFTGPIRQRETLRAWNCRADLFVFPSVFDTNGLVVREAAACGLASVLIRGSCAAENITEGRNGFLCDEDPESLASFLRYACRHKEEIREAGSRAMEEIYLSWEDAVLYAETLYKQLLEKKENGLLKKRPPLADEPLYEMAADAAVRHVEMISRETTSEDSMLDNFLILPRLGMDLIREANQTRKDIENYLRKTLRH